MKPEDLARQTIDKELEETGWVVQDRDRFNPAASLGIAVREFPTDTGPVDYALFVNKRPVGIIEAKASKYGHDLATVENQTARYRSSRFKYSDNIEYSIRFVYECTDKVIYFTDYSDEKARARSVFRFHRPETLNDLLSEKETFRNRLKHLPLLEPAGLRECQFEAVSKLEESFAKNKPRALIQMATGAGKTYAAITSVYRLLKYGGAKRVLFMVDTKNLGVQAFNEFSAFKPQDETRIFPELYSVYNLSSSYIPKDSQVCICTVQRLFSMLTGTELDDADEEEPITENVASKIDRIVNYSTRIPIEFFDVIIIDECHRSIYNVWKQVLEYFDAFLVGLTATPDKRTFGFFQQNVVSEYSREKAIIDNVNVGGDIYLVETDITTNGATIESPEIEKRNRMTREKRWEQLDEPVTYSGNDLDKKIVNESQIRAVIRGIKDAMKTTLFPMRKEVPKTLVFAKDDSHADDIVRIIREEFDEGNEFCCKITYRADDPEALLKSFRNDYYPRVAVTVDMIATGTDIRPIECLVFMRDVRSRNYFEQMIGRGTRTMSKDDLKKVTPSATSNKSHFVVIDAVGVTRSVKTETRPFERKPGVSFKDLMMQVVMGAKDEDTLTTLGGRLTRIHNAISKADIDEVESISLIPMNVMIDNLLSPFDEDILQSSIKGQYNIEPTDDNYQEKHNVVQEEMIIEAVKPFYDPDLRNCLENIRRRMDQYMDTENIDAVTFSGWDKDNTKNADAALSSFRQFIQDNLDEIQALGIFYNQPYKGRGSLLRAIKELYGKMTENGLSVERLWSAYSVKGAVSQKSAKSELTDIVSMIRFELHLINDLVPFDQTVNANFKKWTFARNAGSVHFTDEQMQWLRMIKDHIVTSLSIEMDDFDYMPFNSLGGRGKFVDVFQDYSGMLTELNRVLIQ